MAADLLLAILIKTNLAAAAAILLVLAVRKRARKAFGARLAYALWLVIPLAIGASLLPARQVVIVSTAQPLPAMEPISFLATPLITAPATGEAARALPDLSTLALGLWLIGLIASGLLLLWRQSRFMASLGGVRLESGYLRAEASCAGPMLVGALRPRIILPTDFEARFDAGERDVVLAHETAHLKAGDTRINGLVALVQCVAWFNPLVHVAARALRLDQELACDATVLAARPRDRLLYAKALLKAQTHDQPLLLGCYWPAGANPLKERIIMLKSQSPSRARACVGALIIAGIGLGAGAMAWAAQPARVVVEARERRAVSSQAVPSEMLQMPEAAAPEASTETAQSDASSQFICLTNACMKVTSSAPQGDGATLARAIEAGDPAKVMIAGGTAEDVIAAMRSRLSNDPEAVLNFDGGDQVPVSGWMSTTDRQLNNGAIPQFIYNNGKTSLAFFSSSGGLMGVTTLPGMNGEGIPARGAAYDVNARPLPPAPPLSETSMR